MGVSSVPKQNSSICFDRAPACDGQTDRQTYRHRAIANTTLAQLRVGKNNEEDDDNEHDKNLRDEEARPRTKNISPIRGLTVESSQLTFVPTSKSRDTKARPNIKNPA